MCRLTRINNVLIDLSQVVYVVQTDGVNNIDVMLENGKELEFRGAEAAELWKMLDGEKDWRSED